LDACWGAKVRIRTSLQTDAGEGGGAAGESPVAQAVAMGNGAAASVVVNCAAGATSAVNLGGGGGEGRTGKSKKRTAQQASGVSTAMEAVLASLARSAEAMTTMIATMQSAARPHAYGPHDVHAN